MRVVERYKEQTMKMLQYRAEGNEKEEEKIQGFLDALWDQMSEHARSQVEEWVKKMLAAKLKDK